ncbi:hypothetical protein M9Y10_009466 [Tritrichomonas musculus]|uniref:C2 domain-containing protein n=1 Tax=Tritrichomonas musculus TaxID=1915356 RepID=A0ABR2IPM6_9EUKA
MTSLPLSQKSINLLSQSGALGFLKAKYLALITQEYYKRKKNKIKQNSIYDSYYIANELILRFLQKNNMKISIFAFQNEVRSQFSFTGNQHYAIQRLSLGTDKSNDPLHILVSLMKNSPPTNFHDIKLVQSILQRVPNIDSSTRNYLKHVLKRAGDNNVSSIIDEYYSPIDDSNSPMNSSDGYKVGLLSEGYNLKLSEKSDSSNFNSPQNTKKSYKKCNNILIEDDSRSNFHLVLLPFSQSSDYISDSENSTANNNINGDSSYTYIYESIDSESMRKLQKQNYLSKGMPIKENHNKISEQPFSTDSEFTYVYETLSDDNQSAYTYVYTYDEDSNGLRTNEYSYTYEEPLEDHINSFQNQQNYKLDQVIKTRNALINKPINNNSQNSIYKNQSPSLSISQQAPIFIQRSPKTNIKNKKQKRTANQCESNNHEKPKKLSQRKKIVLRKINLLEEQLKDLESVTITSNIFVTDTTESKTKEDPKVKNLQKKLSHITGKKIRNANDSYSVGNNQYTYTYVYDEESTDEGKQNHNLSPGSTNQKINNTNINKSPKTPHLVLQTMNNEVVSIVDKNANFQPQTEEPKEKNKVDLQISSSIQSEKVLKSNNQPVNDIDRKQTPPSSPTVESNHDNKKDNYNEVKNRSTKLENEKPHKTIKKIYRKIKVEKPRKNDEDFVGDPSITTNSPKKIRNILNIHSDENKDDTVELNDSEFAELNPIDAKKYTETHSIKGLNKISRSKETEKKNSKNILRNESSNLEENDIVKIKIVDELNVPEVDRFCIFYIEGDNKSVKRTQTIGKGQKPSNEIFEFPIKESLPSKLVIFLKKQDLLDEDKIIGTNKIDLKKIPPNETLNKWVPLKSKTGLKTESKIHLVLKRKTKSSDVETTIDTKPEVIKSQKPSNHHHKNNQTSIKVDSSESKKNRRHKSHEIEDNKLLDENSENDEDKNIENTKANKLGGKEIEIDVGFLPESSSSEYSNTAVKKDLPLSPQIEEEEEINSKEELSEYQEESLYEENELSESKEEETQQSQDEEEELEEESISQKELSESKSEEESSEISGEPQSLPDSPSINESSEKPLINETRSYSTGSSFNQELNSGSFLQTNKKAVKLANNSHDSAYFNSNINSSLSEPNGQSSKISNDLTSNQSSIISNSGSFSETNERAVKLANNQHDSATFNSNIIESSSRINEHSSQLSNEIISNQSSAISNSGSFLQINEKAVKIANSPHNSAYFNSSDNGSLSEPNEPVTKRSNELIRKQSSLVSNSGSFFQNNEKAVRLANDQHNSAYFNSSNAGLSSGSNKPLPKQLNEISSNQSSIISNSGSFLQTHEIAVKLANNTHSTSFFDSSNNGSSSEPNEPEIKRSNELIRKQSSFVSNSGSFFQNNEKAVKLANDSHDSTFFNSSNVESLSEPNERTTRRSNELIRKQSSLVSNSGSFFQNNEKAVRLANDQHNSAYFNSSNVESLSEPNERTTRKSNELIRKQSSLVSNSGSFFQNNEKAVRLANDQHNSAYFNSSNVESLSEPNERTTRKSNELIRKQSSLVSNSGSFFQNNEKAVRLANDQHNSAYFNSSNVESLSEPNERTTRKSNELIRKQSSLVSNSGSFFQNNEEAVKLENDSHGSIFFNSSKFSSSQINDDSTITLSYGSSMYNSFSDGIQAIKRDIPNIESDPNIHHSSSTHSHRSKNTNKSSTSRSEKNSHLSSLHSKINENKSDGSDISNTPSLPSSSSLPSVQESSNSIISGASNLSSVSSYSITVSDDLMNHVNAFSSSNEFPEKNGKSNKKDEVKRKSMKIAFSDKIKSIKNTDDDNSHSFSSASNLSHDLTSISANGLADIRLFNDKSHDFTSSENESDSYFKFQSGQKSSSQRSSDSYKKSSNQKSKESHKKSSSKSINVNNLQSSDDLSNSHERKQSSTKNKKKKTDLIFSYSDISLDDVNTLSSSIDSENLSGPLHEQYLQNYAKLQCLNSSPRNLLDPQDFSSSPNSPRQDNFLSSNDPSDSLNLTASEKNRITNSRSLKNSSRNGKSHRNSQTKSYHSSTNTQNMKAKSHHSNLKSYSSKPVIYDNDEESSSELDK